MFKLRSWRGQRCWQLILLLALGGFLFVGVPTGRTQEEEAVPLQPTPAPAPTVADDSLYFADVLVRGQPILQVGSLGNLSARERAEIINRRIASLLAQTDSVEQVSVQTYPDRQIATLQVNNRVLLTVTAQDAQDFGISVDELAARWATQLNRALDRPPFAIDVGQRLYGTVRELIQALTGNLPSLIGALIVVLLTWVIALVVRHGFRVWAERTEGDSSTEVLIGRLGYGGVWVIGSVIALGILGIDFAALLGALGLTSIAIGFSLRDILSNYFSGVILLAARPFRINDQVVIGDYEGTITQIRLRATTLQTYDGRMVYIPNQKVFAASIINNTASLKRRSSVLVGIDYGENISRARAVILEALGAIAQIEPSPVPEVLVTELGTSTVSLEIRFWVDSRRLNFLHTTSLAAQAIKEALEKAGIDMPTDIYTLMFRNSPEVLVAKESSSNSQSPFPS